MSERVFRFRDKASVAPVDVRPSDAFAIKIVAVVGYSSDWAAYIGPSDWPDGMVANQGDKLDAKTAISLFWVMANSGLAYRH